jgi:predicted RNA-binding protein with PIN domain
MQVLIDGYNFLHFLEKKVELPSSLEAQRLWLTKTIHDRLSPRVKQVTLVFDGQDRGRDRYGRVELEFTVGKGSADLRIIELCEENPGRYLVVSNDRQVKTGATQNSCLASSCEDFWKQISQALDYLDDDFILEKIKSEVPVYQKRDSKKRGNPRKLPKSERRLNQSLQRLTKRDD